MKFASDCPLQTSSWNSLLTPKEQVSLILKALQRALFSSALSVYKKPLPTHVGKNIIFQICRFQNLPVKMCLFCEKGTPIRHNFHCFQSVPVSCEHILRAFTMRSFVCWLCVHMERASPGRRDGKKKFTHVHLHEALLQALVLPKRTINSSLDNKNLFSPCIF